MTFIITFIAIILSYVLYTALTALLMLALCPKFGAIVDVIMFWGNIFTRKDGKWVHTRGKFTISVQTHMRLDASKPIPEDFSKTALPIDIIALIIQTIITVVLLFVFLAIPEADRFALINWRWVMLWIFISWALFLVTYIFTFIKTHFIKKTGLEGYCNELIKYIRRGEMLPDNYMRPVEELPFKNYQQKTKFYYYRLYIMHLLWTEQFDRLCLPIHETAAYLRNRTYVLSDTGYYYDVLFYYSRFEYDPNSAMYFMDRIRSTLASDPDANAKRVLAYFAYGVENDKEKARFFTNQALAVVDKFSLPGMERELERKLINELDERLKNEGF